MKKYKEITYVKAYGIFKNVDSPCWVLKIIERDNLKQKIIGEFYSEEKPINDYD